MPSVGMQQDFLSFGLYISINNAYKWLFHDNSLISQIFSPYGASSETMVMHADDAIGSIQFSNHWLVNRWYRLWIITDISLKFLAYYFSSFFFHLDTKCRFIVGLEVFCVDRFNLSTNWLWEWVGYSMFLQKKKNRRVRFLCAGYCGVHKLSTISV